MPVDPDEGTRFWSRRYWRNRPPEDRVRIARIPPRYLRPWKIDPFHDLTEVDAWFDNYESLRKTGTGLFVKLPDKTRDQIVSYVATKVHDLLDQHKVGGYWLTGPELLQIMDAKRNDEEVTLWSPFLVSYISNEFDLVVLEDLGNERSTKYARAAVEEVLKSRYRNLRMTVILSDYPPPTLASRYESTRLETLIKDSMNGAAFRDPS